MYDSSYWNPSEPPDALVEWVIQNVCQAVEDSWSADKISCGIEDSGKSGELVVTIWGPEKPSDTSDIFSMEFNLIDEISSYANRYASSGGPKGYAQKEHMRQMASELHKLASAISNIAAEANKVGCQMD